MYFSTTFFLKLQNPMSSQMQASSTSISLAFSSPRSFVPAAMDSLLLIAVIFFSFVHMDSSRFLEAGTPCLEQILPCEPFLAAPAPDPVCCTSLKGAFNTESECLCSLFNDPELWKSFNVTQEQALKLPAACGIKVDLGLCKSNGPTVSPSSPSLPSGSTNSSSSTSSANSVSVVGMGQLELLMSACLSSFVFAYYVF